MEDLINNVRLLYDIEERASSPPLPNLPAEEESVAIKPFVSIYGSAHTVIKTLPANGATTQTPKLPPRPHRSSTSRRGNSTSSVSDIFSPGGRRSLEDGRGNNYKVVGLMMPKGPKLELRTGGKNTSSSSLPNNETYRDKSSRNTSEVKLTPTVESASTGISWPGVLGIGVGTSGSSPTTASSAFSKDRIHVDSLTKDTNAVTSEIQAPERTGTHDTDYPGSPDTTALEFSTAVNTPTDEHMDPLS
jgi:hypothetical protein